NLRRLVLPAITLATASLAINLRQVRSSLLDVFGLDYMRTARAKGLHERTVITRHALKNALIPVITLIGIQVGAIIEGAFITETIFFWPGIGRLAVQAIPTGDYPVVQGVVLISAFAPFVSPYDPVKVSITDSLIPPGANHLFGTDDLGRDVLSRVIWGSRISLSVGVISVSIGFIVGVSIGLAAGYLGGRFDLFIMRGIHALLAFPALFLAFAIPQALRPQLQNAVL